jgi:hypothetical protein
MHTRYCGNCDEEFRPEILRCSDCGGELEDRYEDDDADGTPTAAPKAIEPAPPEPADAYEPVFRSRDSASLKEAADSLAAAGIPFRGDGSAAGFRLLVRSEDMPAAGAALSGKDGSLFVSDEAQPFVGVEGGVCPACGARVPAGVLECPECGLVVGAEPAKCESCGSPLGPADVKCPVCHPASE